ncbi:MAG: hypothetical protein OHK0011_20930 [Turneriella sp.]
MTQKLRYKGLRIAASLVIVFGVVTFWVLRPLTETPMTTGDFTPLRNDALAAKFTPRFLPHALYGAPERLLYRMAVSRDGNIHIAYHPFYAHEENPHDGSGAALSRIIYTGGLHLKDIMFGPADIELVEVVLDKSGKPIELSYEDAGDYDPQAFSVKHVVKLVKNPAQPFCFTTSSWNHMFALARGELCRSVEGPVPEYFTEAEWQKFRMVKKTEAILRRNRMHRVYERIAAP